jgi:hypothetical protein
MYGVSYTDVGMAPIDAGTGEPLIDFTSIATEMFFPKNCPEAISGYLSHKCDFDMVITYCSLPVVTVATVLLSLYVLKNIIL